MKKIVAVSLFAFGLAGCSATTTTVYTRPVPAATVYRLPSVYPTAAPYAYRRPPVRCYSTWDRTPYGLRERRVCG
jgi:hypothetical protein